ncbi:RloB domain-containing protein [Polynucleobacter paneuropaeus]|jgi:hypothetical protein|nr:RloB domain-containing protein [Polynucleobacter paneuropaeus]
MVKKVRRQRKTLLVMGEGDCEAAFLQYLRNIYCSDNEGVAVTIRNAQGGGPVSIVTQVIRHTRLASYDKKIALLDTDLVWSDDLKKTAKDCGILMVGSKPCLEGLLLGVLKKPAPPISKECKKLLQSHTKADMTEWRHYESHFSKDAFEEARNLLSELDKLLRHFEGK